jgi:hypothetical protein
MSNSKISWDVNSLSGTTGISVPDEDALRVVSRTREVTCSSFGATVFGTYRNNPEGDA